MYSLIDTKDYCKGNVFSFIGRQWLLLGIKVHQFVQFAFSNQWLKSL